MDTLTLNISAFEALKSAATAVRLSIFAAKPGGADGCLPDNTLVPDVLVTTIGFPGILMQQGFYVCLLPFAIGAAKSHFDSVLNIKATFGI